MSNIVIGLLWWIAVIDTVGILFALYGYGSAKEWWR